MGARTLQACFTGNNHLLHEFLWLVLFRRVLLVNLFSLIIYSSASEAPIASIMPVKVLSLLNVFPEAAEAAGDAAPLADPLAEGAEADVAVPVAEALELTPVDDGSFVPCVTMAPFPPGYCSPGAAMKVAGTLVWLEQ